MLLVILNLIRPVIVSMMLTFTMFGCAQTAHNENNVKVNEVRNMIAKYIPKGSSASQVVAFLDNKQIHHSEYVAKYRAIHGIIRNTSQGAFVKGSIELQFIFDENGLLLSYTVKEVFTGP